MCILDQVMDYDWWMHSHEDSSQKEEGDQVAFKGINQKGKRRQGTCLLLLLLYAFCFPLSSTSSKCSNHHVPPSHALLFLNYLQKQDKQGLACWFKLI